MIHVNSKSEVGTVKEAVYICDVKECEGNNLQDKLWRLSGC